MNLNYFTDYNLGKLVQRTVPAYSADFKAIVRTDRTLSLRL